MPRLVPDRGTMVTGAEAWQQCSARGTTVTRLAYIVGFTPLLLEGSIDRERKREEGTSEQLGDTSDSARSAFFLPGSSIFYLKFSPLYHHTAQGAACTCHQEIYTK